MRVIETKVYKIGEHPAPKKAFNWIRENWHDLGDHAVEDAIDSLKGFADCIGAKLDYGIGIAPDRGEHVSFTFPDGETPTLGDIMMNLDLSGNCPFTGVFYDEVILDVFRDVAENAATDINNVLSDIESRVLKCLHDEGDYLYSNEGLTSFCEANAYEFAADGEFYTGD